MQQPLPPSAREESSAKVNMQKLFADTPMFRDVWKLPVLRTNYAAPKTPTENHGCGDEDKTNTWIPKTGQMNSKQDGACFSPDIELGRKSANDARFMTRTTEFELKLGNEDSGNGGRNTKLNRIAVSSDPAGRRSDENAGKKMTAAHTLKTSFSSSLAAVSLSVSNISNRRTSNVRDTGFADSQTCAKDDAKKEV